MLGVVSGEDRVVDGVSVPEPAVAGNQEMIKQAKGKASIDAGDTDGISIVQAIEELIRGQFTDADSTCTAMLWKAFAST